MLQIKYRFSLFFRQKNFVTIESELFAALIKAGAWNPEVAENPSKMWFQRGSRTDKGVSAAGQTFSLQMSRKILANDHRPLAIYFFMYL